MGVKADAVPGRLNQLSIFIKRPGIVYGQCSELCGVNHAFMPICVKAVTLGDYIDWLTSSVPTIQNNETFAAAAVSEVSANSNLQAKEEGKMKIRLPFISEFIPVNHPFLLEADKAVNITEPKNKSNLPTSPKLSDLYKKSYKPYSHTKEY